MCADAGLWYIAVTLQMLSIAWIFARLEIDVFARLVNTDAAVHCMGLFTSDEYRRCCPLLAWIFARTLRAGHIEQSDRYRSPFLACSHIASSKNKNVFIAF